MVAELRTVGSCPVCGHFTVTGEGCQACQIRAIHEEDCSFRVAATGAVGIECEHGFDVCPTCDPCTCKALRLRAQSGG